MVHGGELFLDVAAGQLGAPEAGVAACGAEVELRRGEVFRALAEPARGVGARAACESGSSVAAAFGHPGAAVEREAACREEAGPGRVGGEVLLVLGLLAGEEGVGLETLGLCEGGSAADGGLLVRGGQSEQLFGVLAALEASAPGLGACDVVCAHVAARTGAGKRADWSQEVGHVGVSQL